MFRVELRVIPLSVLRTNNRLPNDSTESAIIG
jgi:hypothetical protein